MILDALYQLSKAKGKTRFNVTGSTGNYDAFETLKKANGELFFYYGDTPEHFKADARRKADKIISNRLGKNVSSVFMPDIQLLFAYGDVNGTNDALLLIFNSDHTQIEIFVAKGKRNNRLQLYHLLSDGELQTEIEALRKSLQTIC